MSQKNEIATQANPNHAMVPQNDADTIDLVELFFRLLDKAQYIIAASLIGAMLALIYTLVFVTPVYTTTAKLYVLNPKDSAINLSDLQLGAALTQDYKEVFNNRIVKERVEKNLGDLFEKDAKVRVSNPSNTRLLYIEVTAKSPEKAQAIANEYASVSREFIAATMDTVQPSLFEDAELPKSPSAPSKTKNTVVGFMIGFMLSCGLIILLYLMDDRIRTAEDIQKCADMPVLGMVPLRENMGSNRKNHSVKKRNGKVKTNE